MIFQTDSPGGMILPVTPDELRQTIYEAVGAALRERERSGTTEAQCDPLLKVDDAVRLLDVTRQTLRKWERLGRLKAVRIGRRVYYRRSDIDKALQGGNV